MRMRPAFHGFATLCRLFNGAEIEGFDRQEELGHYRLTARKDGAGGRRPLALGRRGIHPHAARQAAPSASKASALAIEDGAAVTIGESVIYLVDVSLPDLANAKSPTP